MRERPQRREPPDRPERNHRDAGRRLTTSIQPRGVFPPNTRLGRYTIVRHIKTGGMGAVYRAEDPETGQVVAIKTMLADAAVTPRSYHRFLREVRAACAVRHRNVIQIFGFDVHEGTPFLIMEYLRGQGLNERLARGPLAIERAVEIVGALCSAMAAVHDHGILHRDLKPSNIFLAESDEGEEVKVLDFGLSKLQAAAREPRDPHMTASNTVVGSVPYMSPEQTQGLPVDERSDQFAIGVILYECLTGVRPHEGTTVFDISDNIVRGRFRSPRALRPGIPEGLEKAILRAARLAPADRYPSVRELGAAILPYASREDDGLRPRSLAIRPTTAATATLPRLATRGGSPLDETVSLSTREAPWPPPDREVTRKSPGEARRLITGSILVAGACIGVALVWLLVAPRPGSRTARRSPVAAAVSLENRSPAPVRREAFPPPAAASTPVEPHFSPTPGPAPGPSVDRDMSTVPASGEPAFRAPPSAEPIASLAATSTRDRPPETADPSATAPADETSASPTPSDQPPFTRARELHGRRGRSFPGDARATRRDVLILE